jgi:hypothetical protein
VGCFYLKSLFHPQISFSAGVGKQKISLGKSSFHDTNKVSNFSGLVFFQGSAITTKGRQHRIFLN